MSRQETDWSLFAFIIIIGVVSLIGLGAFVITRPISFEVSGECNSGHIGIDYESTYGNITNNVIILNNLTSDTHQDFIPKFLNLKGIDGLTCKGQLKVNGPVWLGMFLR